MADINQTIRTWSATASNNQPTGATPIGTNLDDNLRTMQASVRQFLASPGSTLASAATVDLSTADGKTIPISGSATVTGLGTESAGIGYLLQILGTQVWKNSSAMPMPASADATFVAGDYVQAESKGAGNWFFPFMTRASGQPLSPVLNFDIKSLGSTAALNTYAVPLYSSDSSVNVKATIAQLITKPTRQVFTSGTATYVTPALVARLFVRLVGGGGGGGAAPSGSGSAGGASTFSTFSAGGANGQAGGVASGGSVNLTGANGSGGGANTGVNSVFMPGGSGAASAFGGGGVGGAGNNSGGASAANSGGGGGGGGAVSGQNAGVGGGAGAYCEGIINTPAATYTYAVGAGGAGGTGSITGGAGGAGLIIVDEYYA